MAVFMLETEGATSSAATISTLANTVASLSSSVSSYDTACEDGFDFAGAKSVIAGNLEACSIKIQNTAKVIENVVSSHTQLQNQLKFTDPTQSTTTKTPDSAAPGSNTYTPGSGSSSYYPSSGGGSSYSGGGGYVPAAPSLPSTKPEEKEEDEVVQATLEKVGYAYADEKNLSEESKKLLSDPNFKYDENGYGRVGDRYVIACDSSVGDVGDVVRFTQKDGTVVDCVVGINTVSDKYKNSVNFIVSQQAEKIQAIDVTKTLLTNNSQVDNIGSLNQIREAEKVIEQITGNADANQLVQV